MSRISQISIKRCFAEGELNKNCNLSYLNMEEKLQEYIEGPYPAILINEDDKDLVDFFKIDPLNVIGKVTGFNSQYINCDIDNNLIESHNITIEELMKDYKVDIRTIAEIEESKGITIKKVIKLVLTKNYWRDNNEIRESVS